MNIYWCTQSTRDLPGNMNWLHPLELEVLSTFRFAKRRKDWLLGRWVAKKAVKSFLGDRHRNLSINNIQILSAADGAPEVFCQGSKWPLIISLSHSHGRAMCVIANSGVKIGCDIEKIEPRSVAFVDDYFTKQEKLFINELAKVKSSLWANLVWSAKESALKALRTGLSIDTRNIEIEFFPGSTAKKWYKLKARSLGGETRFYGYWQHKNNFILSFLSDTKEIQFLEI